MKRMSRGGRHHEGGVEKQSEGEGERVRLFGPQEPGTSGCHHPKEKKKTNHTQATNRPKHPATVEVGYYWGGGRLQSHRLESPGD